VSLPYQYAADEAVLIIFSAIPPRQRSQLMRIFDLIAEDPFIRGDWVKKDSDGTEYQVKSFGRWSVIWRVDHPDSCVRIIDVELLR